MTNLTEKQRPSVKFEIVPNRMNDFYTLHLEDNVLMIELDPRHSFFRQIIEPLLNEEMDNETSKKLDAILGTIAAHELAAWDILEAHPENTSEFEEYRRKMSQVLHTLVED